MTNTAPAAPPTLTTTEKAAVLGAVFVLGVLLAIPVTRDLITDSLATTARFIGDTAVQGARAIWLLIQSVFGGAA